MNQKLYCCDLCGKEHPIDEMIRVGDDMKPGVQQSLILFPQQRQRVTISRLCTPCKFFIAHLIKPPARVKIKVDDRQEKKRVTAQTDLPPSFFIGYENHWLCQ